MPEPPHFQKLKGLDDDKHRNRDNEIQNQALTSTSNLEIHGDSEEEKRL